MEIVRKLEFYTNVPGLVDQYPPVPAGKQLPGWFSKMPSHWGEEERSKRNLTLKGCPGIWDIMSSGYIVPLWCDYEVTVDKDGNVKGTSADQSGHFTLMHPNSTEGFPFKAGVPHVALKFDSPWRLKTPPGTSVYQLPLTYEVPTGIEVLPGIVHTDMYHQINSVCLWHGGPGTKLFKAGTPWFQVIPYVRNQWALTVEENQDKVTELGTTLGGVGRGQRLTIGAYREARKNYRRY